VRLVLLGSGERLSLRGLQLDRRSARFGLNSDAAGGCSSLEYLASIAMILATEEEILTRPHITLIGLLALLTVVLVAVVASA
jgi:hypothetical protein